MSSNDQDFRVLSGVNQFSNRDVITTTVLYGQIDRWIMDQKVEGTVLLNTSNRKKVKIGTKLKIADSLFSSHLKLKTMIDRTKYKKYENHAKGNIHYIAKKLGYSDKSGLYKMLAPLYEIGLIDLNESNYKGKTLTDLIVYDYPIYADSPICELVKCRDWEKRDSFGMAFSKKGTVAKKKKREEVPVEKSLQDNLEVPVEKSLQVPVEKSLQVPVEKSLLSNKELNSSNILNISNDHLVKDSRFSDIEKTRLDSFISEQKIDDDLLIEFLDRIYENPPKTNSYEKYFNTVVESIKITRTKPKTSRRKAIRREMVPNFIKKEKDDTEENEASKDDSVKVEINLVVKVFAKQGKTLEFIKDYIISNKNNFTGDTSKENIESIYNELAV